VFVGSTCDVCVEEDPRAGSVLFYDIETGASGSYARGLRNTVFSTLHPVTGEVWGTEMGRDMLGDALPPDEVNIIRKGANYGWPICYGNNVHDTQFDRKVYVSNPCMAPLETPAHIELPAHVAPLGIAFFGEESWPEEYWFDALVALHGSWNSTSPVGYEVVRLQLDATGAYQGTEPFISGWLKDGKALGRPAGILISPGTIFISDDKAGVIYQIRRNFQ
jgi:glucose/arabinose dehydrogenase